MPENDVTQSGNIASGDIAGRDLTKKTSMVFEAPAKTISAIQVLYQRLEKEKADNAKIPGFIADLDYYFQPLSGEVIGLDGKLRNGKYDSLIDYALRVKEKYHKKLYQHQFSETAQLINKHFLTLVESCFQTQVYPHIFAGATPEEVTYLVQKFIIDRLLDELGDNVLDFAADDINGMLYFLTGNCHLKWAR